MFAKFEKYLHEKCQIESNQTIIVGVSGGPDSLALMALLVEAGQAMVVAHVNHQLRPTANAEEEGVIKLAKQLGIQCVSSRVEVKQFAQNKSLSLEEAARILRYQFLFEEAEKHQAKAVAVAHTADDQVETFFLHLLRGTGSNGLRGMKTSTLPNTWSNKISLVRPLLGFWRTEILEILTQKGIQPFWDLSNWDNQFARNRIRNQLIPILEEYNPAIRKLIWQTCSVLDADLELLDSLEQAAWQKVCTEENTFEIFLDIGELNNQPLSMQRRIVRRAWLTLTQYPDVVDFVHIDNVIAWINRTTSGKLELDPSLRWFNDDKRAVLVKKGYEDSSSEFPQFKREGLIQLNPESEIEIGNGWIIQTEVIENLSDSLWRKVLKSNPFEAWIDLDRCQLPLALRAFQEGDRFEPFRMSGAQVKLSDIFINRKIPQRFRHHYPLVCDSQRIIWVPGYTIANSVQLSDQTQRIVHLTLKKFRI